MKTSNFSADNFKKILDLDGSTPALRLGDTGQRIPCFDSCQLITTLMYNMCAISCLLYTSDAADEEDSVDLGGRRIIKKK